MTQNLTQVETKRCAVGKIDLKGRLVYVDDSLEQLLGDQRENLFGKELTDFLCEESQEQLKAILNIRNHYETYYDALTVNITNLNNETISVRMIASLNFAGGNPVNFLMIIDQVVETNNSSQQTVSAEQDISILNEFIDIESINGICDYLPKLFKQSGADHLIVYKLDDPELEEIKSVSSDTSDLIPIGEPGPIHIDIAAMDGEYSFVDDHHVANAIENYKNSPNEYLKGFYIDGSNYLLRAVYREDYNHQEALESIAALKDSCHLFDKIIKLHQGGANVLPDVKFTIGFLDTFRLPAFLTNNEGDIIGYNPTLTTLVKENEVIDNYMTLLNSFNSKSNLSLVDRVSGFLNRTERSSDEGQLHLIVKLPNRNTADLYVVSLGDQACDLSACFVFVPHRRLKIEE